MSQRLRLKDSEGKVIKSLCSRQGSAILGRARRSHEGANNLCCPLFPSSQATQLMSQMHCRIDWVDHKEAYIFDIGSTNGTYLRQVKSEKTIRIIPFRSYRLHHGDTIVFGKKTRDSASKFVKPLALMVDFPCAPVPSNTLSEPSLGSDSCPSEYSSKLPKRKSTRQPRCFGLIDSDFSEDSLQSDLSPFRRGSVETGCLSGGTMPSPISPQHPSLDGSEDLIRNLTDVELLFLDDSNQSQEPGPNVATRRSSFPRSQAPEPGSLPSPISPVLSDIINKDTDDMDISDGSSNSCSDTVAPRSEAPEIIEIDGESEEEMFLFHTPSNVNVNRDKLPDTSNSNTRPCTPVQQQALRSPSMPIPQLQDICHLNSASPCPDMNDRADDADDESFVSSAPQQDHMNFESYTDGENVHSALDYESSAYEEQFNSSTECSEVEDQDQHEDFITESGGDFTPDHTTPEETEQPNEYTVNVEECLSVEVDSEDAIEEDVTVEVELNQESEINQVVEFPEEDVCEVLVEAVLKPTDEIIVGESTVIEMNTTADLSPGKDFTEDLQQIEEELVSDQLAAELPRNKRKIDQVESVETRFHRGTSPMTFAKDISLTDEAPMGLISHEEQGSQIVEQVDERRIAPLPRRRGFGYFAISASFVAGVAVTISALASLESSGFLDSLEV